MALNQKITDWDGKRVWLVGASTGIGAALAAALFERGARVAVSARSEAARTGGSAASVTACNTPDSAWIRACGWRRAMAKGCDA